MDSVWIHLDGTARPTRIGGGFDAYALAAQGRSASTRLTLPDPPGDAVRTPWPLRATDVDVMGHVNNAAYWSAIEHRLGGRTPDLLRGPLRARLDYRHPLDLDDEAVEIAEFPLDGGLGLAFVVGATAKAVACVEELGRIRESGGRGAR